MSPIRVLVADDHPLIIEGLTTALAHHDIVVVGKVTAATHLVAAFTEKRPDVVVLDVRFADAAAGHDAAGLDAAGELLKFAAQARIVFYTQFDQDEFIREAYRIGGLGFVQKSHPSEVLAEAIRQVHGGQRHFLPAIAERLALLGLRSTESPLAALDPRELEIFRLLAQGKTNAEIAELLGLSLKTISTASFNLKEKLGVHRPAEITLLAVRHKFIQP